MLLTIEDASKYLKLSRATLARMVRREEIPTVRLGRRRVLFRRETLDALIERAEHPARKAEGAR